MRDGNRERPVAYHRNVGCLSSASQEGSSLVGNGTGSRVEDEDGNSEGVSSSKIDVDCDAKRGEGCIIVLFDWSWGDPGSEDTSTSSGSSLIFL